MLRIPTNILPLNLLPSQESCTPVRNCNPLSCNAERGHNKNLFTTMARLEICTWSSRRSRELQTKERKAPEIFFLCVPCVWLYMQISHSGKLKSCLSRKYILSKGGLHAHHSRFVFLGRKCSCLFIVFAASHETKGLKKQSTHWHCST